MKNRFPSVAATVAWSAAFLLTSTIFGCAPMGHLEIVEMMPAPQFSRSIQRSNAHVILMPGENAGSASDERRDARLAADLRALNLFAGVDLAGHSIAQWCRPEIKLTIRRNSTSRLDPKHLVGSTARSVLTLGIADSPAPVREHLEASVSIELERWDGDSKQYAARGQATVDHALDRSSSSVQQRLVTRVTWHALKQISDDVLFHRIAADRLKVTKPKRVTVKEVSARILPLIAPFSADELGIHVANNECGEGRCLQSERRANGEFTSILSRVWDTPADHSAILSEEHSGVVLSPELPVRNRIVELTRPVPVTANTPLGYCQITLYQHDRNSRTIYSTCGRSYWTERIEMCHTQVPM